MKSDPVTFEELWASTELSSVQLSRQIMEEREQDAKKALDDIQTQLQSLRDREITCSRTLERRRTRRLALTSCSSRFTDEILLKILRCVISNNPTSSQRSSLRLVCKKWSRFFDTITSLWQEIHVKIPSELGHIRGCHKYCEKAMEKGGKTKLDIQIDCSRVPTAHELLLDLFEKAGHYREYDEQDGNHQCCLAEWILEPYIWVLHSLQGPQREHVTRWRSVELIAGSTHSFSYILSSMLPLPNLETLKITGKWHQHELSDDDEACLVELKQTFPMLRELSFTSLKWGPSVGGTISASLTSLSVSECSSSIFNWIPHCSGLARLHLAHLETLEEFKFGSSAALLPLLKIIFLAGRLPNGFWEAFQFPLLENMEMGSKRVEMVGLDFSRLFKSVEVEVTQGWGEKFPRLRSFAIFLGVPRCDWKEYRVFNLRSFSALDGLGVIREYFAE